MRIVDVIRASGVALTAILSENCCMEASLK